LRINTQARKLIDFKEACHFNQTSQDSIFTQKEIISLATKDGRLTYSNNQLTITDHTGRKKIKVHPSERERVIKKYFDMTVHRSD